MLSQEEVEALRKAVNFGLANINEEESDIENKETVKLSGGEIMLDIKYVRENPEIVKQNIRNKFRITNWNWLIK